MTTITTFGNTAEGRERSLYAILAEKERRSGSRRTVVGYSRMMQHFFRHSAAKLRRDSGESIENVSRFLDASSLQVTSICLRRLEGEADASWAKVAAAIDVRG